MKKLLFLFLALSLMHCQVEEYRNLIPGEKEKAERKKERENVLNCIIQTAICTQNITEPWVDPISLCGRDLLIRQACWGETGAL